MNCPKCNGCMTLDPSLDFYLKGTGWRCINCGTRREVGERGVEATWLPTKISRTHTVRQRP